MHPVLFELGPLTIHTYGFLIAIGFIVGVTTIRKLAARSGLNQERMVDLAFWLLLTGFIGARLLFIITRWEYFSENPGSIFKVWEGGLVFFGGLLAAFPFGMWYIKRFGIPAWKAADAAIPGLVIAHMFGRFGCVTAGCCYGKPTGTDFGLVFNSDLVDEAYHGIALHPTQLYEAFSLLILFAGLLWIFKRKAFDGQVAVTYLIAYPIIRSIIEVFRGDVIRGFVIEDVLSTSQFISILVVIGAAFILITRLKAAKAEGS